MCGVHYCSSADGDSAVESSSDEGEGGEVMEGVGGEEGEEESGESSDDDSGSNDDKFNPFGLNDGQSPAESFQVNMNKCLESNLARLLMHILCIIVSVVRAIRNVQIFRSISCPYELQ